MSISSVSPVTVFVAGFVASSVLVASSFVAELLLFPVRLFSPFYLQRSVAMLASNFTLKRDAAEARRPLAPR